MLNRMLFLSLVLASAIFGFGCVESAMLVKVKPDGGGHVVYRMLMAEEMMNGIQMMANLSGGLSGAPASPAASSNLMDGVMHALADQLGDGVTFQSGAQKTNDRGWKGFEAVYAFDDVTRLKVADLDPLAGAGGGSPMGADLGPKYRFEFTPGPVALLELVPREPAPAATLPQADSGLESLTNLTGGLDLGPLGNMGGMPDRLGGMMSGMMQKVLQGMRISLVVSVEGEVVESNATFPSERHANAFILVDIPFDTILSDPRAAALMTQPAPDPAALAELKIPGLRIEEPGKTIRVKFR